MPATKLDIEQFLQLSAHVPVFDVRSPGEYEHAHIPGAHSFPLFTNEQRKVVGTAYKQESREKAIKIGLEYFGKSMVQMVEAAEKIITCENRNSREVLVHCWRGGMRSAAVAWLLDLYGFKVSLLRGGYKAYRKWVLHQLEKDHELKILGGYTGSDKTEVIKKLQKKHSVIDIEALARHKGSAFGNLEQIKQPGQEFFENLLATELCRCAKQFPGEAIWLEGESQRLGLVNIPFTFFTSMRKAPMIFLNVPFEQRLSCIVEGYGKCSREKLIAATIRIKKKLGGLEMKNAVNFLLEDDIRSSFAILLKYYDKLYLKSITDNVFKERQIIYADSDTTDPKVNLEKIITHVS